MNLNHKVLFQSQIPRSQLMSFIQNLHKKQIKEQITVIIKKASEHLNKMIHPSTQENKTFFTNYQTLLNILYEQEPQIASNLALHRINIYAQRLIEANNPKKAKRVLESVFSYLHQSFIDPLLFSTALNNLSFLYFHENDFELSLNTALQNVTFCQQSIKNLETQKNKKQKSYIQSLSIVLINSLKLSKQILTICQEQKLFDRFQFILNSQKQSITQKHRQFLFQSDQKYAQQLQQSFSLDFIKQQKLRQNLRKLKKTINKVGYNACISYLGQQSYFCRFFDKQQRKPKKLKNTEIQTENEDSIIFVNRNQFNIFQSQTLKKLNNIHEMLKFNSITQNQFRRDKQQEQIKVYLSTKNSQQNIQFEDHIEDIKHEKQQIKSLQKSHFYQNQRKQNQINFFINQEPFQIQTFETDGWIVEIKLFKTQEQKLGGLQFRCKNIYNNQSFVEIISQNKLMKMLSLRSLQDTLPYEYSLKEIPPSFIQVCIKPYLSVTSNGRIIHHPRARTLTHQPIVQKFLSSQCYIFFFHIRAFNFRIAISPLEESGSIYLNVELTQNSLEQLFTELIDPAPQKIRLLFQDQLKRKNKKAKNQVINKKSILIKNQQKLKDMIIEVVKGFQRFLCNEENNVEGNDIFGWIEKDQYYWKFNENESNKSGSFIKIKFNKNNKIFSIYGEQFNFQAKKSNQINRKGSFEFKRHQFRYFFGFQPQFNSIKQKIKRIQEILSYKYTFKKNPNKSNHNFLSQIQDSRLNKDINSMYQRTFNQQSFYVDFITHQKDSNYLCIITASVVTLSNIFPVGIKVSFYDPNQVNTKAFFINIFSQDWSYQSFSQQKGRVFKCHSTQLLNKTQTMFRPLVQKYPQEQNYFLTFWLKSEGFQNILSKVLNQNSCLYIQNNLNSIVNWYTIFQE